MRRLLLSFALIATIAGGFAIAPLPASAQDGGFDISKGIIGNLGSEACRERGDCGWCDFVDMMVILQKVILYLFGGLALVMIIWGAFGIVTATGNQEKIAANRKLIISTLFGVLIILAAFFVTVALVAILTEPTGGRLDVAPLSGDWWKKTLQCYTPRDEKYCETAPDGSLCYKPNGDPFACKGGACTADACATNPPGLGGNASCVDITSSPQCNAAGGLRANCKRPDCVLNVCRGNANIVCCRQP